MGRLSPGHPERPPRPGRLRRYVLRPALWSLALVAVALFLFRLWLDSGPARTWAKGQIETRLGAELGRTVTLDDVAFELLPLSVELRGFEIAGLPVDRGAEEPGAEDGAFPEAPPPLLRAPYAFLEAELFALERRRLHLRLVRLERPEIDLRFFKGGGDNIFEVRRAGDREPFEVLIDQIEIIGGQLALDHGQVPLQLDASNLRTRFRGLGDGNLEGRLSVRDVLVALPSARPVRVSVVAKGQLDARRLLVEEAHVDGDGVDFALDGSCLWAPRTDRKCSFKARGTSSGAFLQELGYFRSLRGDFDFDGTYGWRPGSVGWSGGVSARRLVLWDRVLRDVSGQLLADRFGVRLELDGARYAGGRLRGTVGVEVRRPRRPLTVDLRFEELWLDEVLADQRIPVDGLAARMAVDVIYRCPLRQCRAGDGQAEVTLTPDPDGPGVPLGGSFPLRMDYGTIFAEAADLVNPRQSLLATGSYSLLDRAGRFDYQVETADVGELVPLLPLAEVPDYLPREGAGHLEGSLLVRSGQVWTSVEVGLDDVATPRTPAITHLEGGFDVTPWAVENLRLTLLDVPTERGREGEVVGESTLGIIGRLPFDGVSDLRFDAVRVPMAVVRPWVDVPLDLEGQITGQLDLDIGERRSAEPPGGPSGPAGESVNAGRLIAIVAPARIAGVDANGLQAEMSWSRGVVRFADLTVLAEAGSIRGDGELDWSSGALDLDLAAEGLDLRGEPFTLFAPRRDLGGEVDLTGRLAGRLGDPELTLAAAVRELTVGTRELGGGGELSLTWKDKVLRAEASLLGVAALRGGGRLDGRRADLGFQVEAGDLRRLSELVDLGGRRFDGEMAGRLQVSGPFDGLAARLHVERLGVRLDQRRLDAVGSSHVALSASGFQVDGLRLRDAATESEVALSGVGGWDQSVELRLQASVDLDWLAYALPDLEVTGRLDLDGTLGGTLGAPLVRGTGRLSSGTLDIPGFTERFSQLEGRVLFEGERARIEDVRGAFAGGRASLSGVLDLGAEGEGAGVDYRLQLAGRGLSFPYLDGWALSGDTDLSLRSTADGHLLAGEARLERLEYLEDVRFDLGT
ncbi:MAG: hypothetical protein AAFX50_01195, partial [Acidobacteriota bacterium]